MAETSDVGACRLSPCCAVYREEYEKVLLAMAPITHTPLHTLTDGLYAAAGDLLKQAGDGPWRP